jgi:ABC-type lipoprotein export system ATPase subunit
MGAAILEFRGVSKFFGTNSRSVRALVDVSLELRAGEFAVLTGPSGSGKSTLVHLAAGLETPTCGIVSIAGTELSGLRDNELSKMRCREVGLVFQAFHLVDYLDAIENVALPLRFSGFAAAEAAKRARGALAAVGLANRGDHRPSELSGGEMQRVAVARALVIRPKLLLADEPTGNLDSASGAEVLALLRTLSDQENVTVLLATHDERAAVSASHVLRLQDGALITDSRPSARGPLPA